ncbi:HIT family protein [Microbacterium arborescens]
MDWREDRIGAAHRGENPTVLVELAAGFAVMGDVQFLPGYCVLLGKDPSVKALAEMPRAERVQFLADADLLATAVERACRSSDPQFRRVNIEVLGNTDAFVHAHIWPRYEWEPSAMVTRPVWLYEPTRWSDPETALGSEPAGLRERIATELMLLVAEESGHDMADQAPPLTPHRPGP